MSPCALFTQPSGCRGLGPDSLPCFLRRTSSNRTHTVPLSYIVTCTYQFLPSWFRALLRSKRYRTLLSSLWDDTAVQSGSVVWVTNSERCGQSFWRLRRVTSVALSRHRFQPYFRSLPRVLHPRSCKALEDAPTLSQIASLLSVFSKETSKGCA